LGHRENFLAAMKLFEDENVKRHNYVVIRKDDHYNSSPSCYTNMFSEIPQLGPNPIVFAPEITKK